MPKKAPAQKHPSEASNHNNRPLSQIQEFYRFMVEQKLDTLEYDHQGLHVRLVRQHPQVVPMPVPVSMTDSQLKAGSIAPIGTAAASPAPVAVNGMTIKSPMMGIFYRASTPSSPPFVKTGDTVKKGQVLCLIEAMKVFNEVKAEFDCAIANVLLENGKPVKAGQDLYIVEKK